MHLEPSTSHCDLANKTRRIGGRTPAGLDRVSATDIGPSPETLLVRHRSG